MADSTHCELCGEPLDDSQPWQIGLDGEGAHTACLGDFLDNQDEEGDFDD